MIIRLSGGEKKPKSRLSVLELSTRKISLETNFKKIRNAEMGISPARQMRSETLCLRILLGNRVRARVKQMTGLRYLFPWLRAKRGIFFRKILLLDLRNDDLLFPWIFILRSSRGMRQWVRTGSSDGLRRRSCCQTWFLPRFVKRRSDRTWIDRQKAGVLRCPLCRQPV